MSLNVVTIAAEVAPFSKSGGLGDVTRSLPKALNGFGHNVVTITPFYRSTSEQLFPRQEMGGARIVVHGKPYRFHFLLAHVNAQMPIIFTHCEELFFRSEMYGHHDDNLRYYLFTLASFEVLRQLKFRPDVIHCHDWHTGLFPNLLVKKYARETQFKSSATLFTIHNLLHQLQGDWWTVPQKKRDRGHGLPPTDPKKLQHVNFTRRGIMFADVINTVSERYAREILTPEFGQGLDGKLRQREKDVYGIINGIDYAVYNPFYDRHLWHQYDWNALDKKRKNKYRLQTMLGLEPNTDIPLLGVVHRLTEFKGFHLLQQLLPVLMKLPLQIAIVGSGEQSMLREFRRWAKKHPRRLSIISPFTEEIGSRVYAGSDMFLMPSRFEPCGISQLISLRYGSVPIVHETGGLSDTIQNYNPKTGRGNGFTFSTYEPENFLVAIVRALETYRYPRVWEHLTWQGMRASFSWELPARKYVQLYRRAMNNRLRHK